MTPRWLVRRRAHRQAVRDYLDGWRLLASFHGLDPDRAEHVATWLRRHGRREPAQCWDLAIERRQP